jgi:hypothetical protein
MEESTKRPSRLINRKAVRQFLVDFADKHRAHKFNRVAPEVYDQLEADLRERCRRIVHSQPSKGKTIR